MRKSSFLSDYSGKPAPIPASDQWTTTTTTTDSVPSPTAATTTTTAIPSFTTSVSTLDHNTPGSEEEDTAEAREDKFDQ